MDIGENIRKIRDLKGVSQEVLSHEIGISQKQLSRIETNQVSPTLALLEKICESLEIKLSELLNFNENLVFNNYNQNQGDGEFGVYNNTEVRQIEHLYQKLLDAKDQTIRTLENEVQLQKKK